MHAISTNIMELWNELLSAMQLLQKSISYKTDRDTLSDK